MYTLKKMTGIGCTLACCAFLLCGCGEDRQQKEQKKEGGTTVQQQMGQEAAQAMKEPAMEARKAAQVQENATQAIKEAAQEVKPAATGQEKRKLEGC